MKSLRKLVRFPLLFLLNGCNLVSPSKPKSIRLLNRLIGTNDGDVVKFVCSGNVGRPPDNFQFQRFRSDKTLNMNYTETSSFLREVSYSCSYYRTSYITYKVTAEDNQSVVRCAAVSVISEGNMYVESELLDVNYAVRMPTIVKHPNKTDYLVGFDTHITLSCTTNSNPKPKYLWYKDNEIEAISTRDILSITDITTNNSGVYACFVSNTFNGVRNTERVQLHVSILKQEIEENQTSSTTFSTTVINKTPLLKKSSIENTAVIVVGAVCGSILLVLCVILFGVIHNKNKCLLMKSRNDRSVDYVNTTQQQNPSLYEVVDSAIDIHNYEQLSRREHVYENTNF